MSKSHRQKVEDARVQLEVQDRLRDRERRVNSSSAFDDNPGVVQVLDQMAKLAAGAAESKHVNPFDPVFGPGRQAAEIALAHARQNRGSWGSDGPQTEPGRAGRPAASDHDASAALGPISGRGHRRPRRRPGRRVRRLGGRVDHGGHGLPVGAGRADPRRRRAGSASACCSGPVRRHLSCRRAACHICPRSAVRCAGMGGCCAREAITAQLATSRATVTDAGQGYRGGTR